MTPAESNKALVRRFYEEIDKGNIDVFDEVVAEDYLDYNPPPLPGLASGREGLKQALKMFQHERRAITKSRIRLRKGTRWSRGSRLLGSTKAIFLALQKRATP